MYWEFRVKRGGQKIVSEKIIIVIVAICILLEAVLSCALSALENCSEKEIEKQMRAGNARAKQIFIALEEMQRCNTFILSIMTILNLGIGIFVGTQLIDWIGYFTRLEFQYIQLEWILFGISMIFFFFGVILFGNIIPRKVGKKNPEKKAGFLVAFLLRFLWLMKPFIWMLECTVNFLLKIFGDNPEDYRDNVTEEEIIAMVNEGLEHGVLENNEVEMISNIIEMDEKEVRDIMTRRQRIMALDGEQSLEDAMKIMLEKSFSRFPVYTGDIDNIIGIVFWKDITKYYIQNQDRSIPLSKLAKKPYFVPDTQKIDLLFEEMQMKKIHMAIAIDEYGQTAGIVAMEDILEEIVGNIFDEFDEDERMIIRQKEGKYYMRGLTKLKDVAEELHLDMEKELEDYDTLNGFLVSKLGHIPSFKEKVTINFQGYEFHVVDVKDKIIRFVRVRKKENM